MSNLYLRALYLILKFYIKSYKVKSGDKTLSLESFKILTYFLDYASMTRQLY